jgi:hypothetical protein
LGAKQSAGLLIILLGSPQQASSGLEQQLPLAAADS